MIRGTVSSVEVSKHEFEPIEWVDVAFRESPIVDVRPTGGLSEFNMCASVARSFSRCLAQIS